MTFRNSGPFGRTLPDDGTAGQFLDLDADGNPEWADPLATRPVVVQAAALVEAVTFYGADTAPLPALDTNNGLRAFDPAANEGGAFLLVTSADEPVVSLYLAVLNFHGGAGDVCWTVTGAGGDPIGAATVAVPATFGIAALVVDLDISATFSATLNAHAALWKITRDATNPDDTYADDIGVAAAIINPRAAA